MTKRMNSTWQLEDHHFNADPELFLNIVDRGALHLMPQAQVPGDLKLERDHIFPRKLLTAHNLGDFADHIGNYRLVNLPVNRRKRADMPDHNTDFFGRYDPAVETLYTVALERVNRETYLAFRDRRAELIRSEVQAFLELDAVPLQSAVEDDKPLRTESAATSQEGAPQAAQPRPAPDRIAPLGDLYANSAPTRIIIDHFGSRQRNQGVTKLDTLEAVLRREGTPLGYREILDVMRQLVQLGLGRFIPGRKGFPTRFEWSVESLHVRSMATSQASEPVAEVVTPDEGAL
jgi:hypothetical protein